MIGIVILNFNNYLVTIRCIESIMQTSQLEYKIIVVDNGSTNNSVQVLKSKYVDAKSIEIVLIEKNIGFAAGNNVGIKRCRELNIRYCILSNSDIIFQNDSIYQLYSVIQDRDDAIIVGPRIVDANNVCWPSSVLTQIRYIDALGIGRLFKKSRIDETEDNIIKEVYALSGCCFIADLIKFHEVGIFDEGTFLYYEENILAKQIEDFGYKTLFTSKAQICHAHGASSGIRKTFTCSEYIRSCLYYWKKYRNLNDFFLYLILYSYLLKQSLKNFISDESKVKIGEVRKAGCSSIIS